MAALLTARAPASAGLVPIPREFAGTGVDYSTVNATAVHLSALTSMIVPNATRDLSDEVYEVFHCIVEDVEPYQNLSTSSTWVVLSARRSSPSSASARAMDRPCPIT